MERHVLELLLSGDDETSVIALATLRSGATARTRTSWAGTSRAARPRAWPACTHRDDRFCRSDMDHPALPHRGRQRTGGLCRLAAAACQEATALGARWGDLGPDLRDGDVRVCLLWSLQATAVPRETPPDLSRLRHEIHPAIRLNAKLQRAHWFWPSPLRVPGP